MKKKVLGALLSAAMVATLLVGCGGEAAPAATEAPAAEAPAADAEAPAADAEAPADEAVDQAAAATTGGKKVGVAMPTQSSERWINDGARACLKIIIL